MGSLGNPDRKASVSAVLLVEDDLDIRQSMRSLLELDGFKVVTAANGAQALSKLRRGLRPCVILLDLMMPIMDGFEFRKEQMQDEALSVIPVVVYSGHYNPKACAARLGATALLQKPLDVDALLKLVENHCSKH
ncbi:MAG: response regulator [Candidatus Binatia bacterium]